MDGGSRLGEALARLRQDRALAVGVAVAVLWLLLVIGFAIFGPDADAPRTGWERVGTLAAVLTPLALIALAVGAARSLAALRAEAEELRAMLGAMRGEGAAPAEAQPLTAERDIVMRPATPRPSAPRPAATPRPADVRRPAAAPLQRAPAGRAAEPPQPSLDLGGPAPVAVDTDDLIRALNFPDGPDDVVAIQSLRAALRDPDTARLIRASQDMVMLLAEHGLYMDDRPPAPDRPDLWRRLARGERGAALAGITTPSPADVMEPLAAALRSDEVFRDAAHHFLRHWDRMLSRELPDLDDPRVTALADTRSGRAFTLLAEAAGTLE